MSEPATVVDTNSVNTTPSSPNHVTPTSQDAVRTPQALSSASSFSSESPHGRDSSCVQVAVRIRPLLPGEPRDSVVSADTTVQAIQVAGGGPRFTFDAVFAPTATQADVYQQAVKRLVGQTLTGYNATIFAYGQTGYVRSCQMFLVRCVFAQVFCSNSMTPLPHCEYGTIKLFLLLSSYIVPARPTQFWDLPTLGCYPLPRTIHRLVFCQEP